MPSGNEQRVVFDIRGKRRQVVKFVYVAILMVASLFLLVGPVHIGSLFGASNSASNPAKQYEERAVKIERELRKQPANEELLAKLTRTRMNAGQVLLVTGPSGEVGLSAKSRDQYLKASAAWSEYLEASDEPSPGLAQQTAGILFRVAQVSRSYPEASAILDAAVEAQKIYVEQRPSLRSLSTQALYTLYTGNYKEAEKVLKAAEAKATSKFQREQLGNQFDSVKKEAVKFQQVAKEAGKAAKGGGGATGNPGSRSPPGGGFSE